MRLVVCIHHLPRRNLRILGRDIEIVMAEDLSYHVKRTAIVQHCELRKRVARHRPTTHDLYSAKICYRHHPFYDTEVEVVRYLRRTNPAVLLVKLPAGPQLAVPECMLSRLVCEQLKEEAEPRIAIAALQELRQLIDIQPFLISVGEFLDRGESPVGGPHAQPQECGLSPAETPLRDRRGLDRTSRTGARRLSKSV